MRAITSQARVTAGLSVVLAFWSFNAAADPEQETLLRLDATSIAIPELEERIPELMAKVWLSV